MSTKNSSFTAQLLRFIAPLGLICIVLALLISRQGIRFRLTENAVRIDGAYQLTYQANTILDRSHKPDVILTPSAATDVLVAGNRITIVSKEPLLSDTSYDITITNARAAQGQRQGRAHKTRITTPPSIAYGVRRTGMFDSIEKIAVSNRDVTSDVLYTGDRISHLAISPDVIWFATFTDAREHALYSLDKKSRHVTKYLIPQAVMIDTLEASKQTNMAIVTVSSNQQINGQPLAYENTVLLATASTGSVEPVAEPMNTAAVALLSPDGSLYITQSREGSVYARGLADTEAIPMGRTRLAGPFSGNSKTLLLRNLSVATLVTLGTSDQATLQFIPDTASQVALSFTGASMLYTITEFDGGGSGKTRLYQAQPDSQTPRFIYELPDTSYGGRMRANQALQFIAVEQYQKSSQFDAYLQNAKASGAETALVKSSGELITTSPLVDIVWE